MRTTLGLLIINTMLAVSGHGFRPPRDLPALEAEWTRADIEQLAQHTKSSFCRPEMRTPYPFCVHSVDVDAMLNRHGALLGPALPVDAADVRSGMQWVEEQERKKWAPVANATWNVLAMYIRGQGIDIQEEAAFVHVITPYLFREVGTGTFRALDLAGTLRQLVPVWPEIVYDPKGLTPLIGFQFNTPMPGLVRALQQRILQAGLTYRTWGATRFWHGTTVAPASFVLAVVPAPEW